MANMWKRQEVAQWLEQTFSGEDVPEFELTDTTVSHLHQMAVASQRNDRNLQLCMDDLQHKCDEYNAEAQRLAAILDRLTQMIGPIGSQHLSKSGQSSLQTLVKLAELLYVKDSSETSYNLALQELDDEMYHIEMQQCEETKRLKDLKSKAHQATFKVESLTRTMELVKQNTFEKSQLLDSRKNDQAFFKKKARQIDKDMSKLQTSQDKVETEKTHEYLVKKSDHLCGLNAELAPLKDELQSYMVLPPNKFEAKIMIEQKKRELNKLEKELEQCVDIGFT